MIWNHFKNSITMKNHIITLFAFLAFSIGANSMGFDQARYEALFLTDKMVYELNLSLEQMEAVYEINLDYLLSVNRSQDIFGIYWDRRNTDMRYVLSRNQYARFINTNYFYRPLNWVRNSWSLALYGIYADRHAFYFGRPNAWFSFRGGRNTGVSHYSGRNFFPPQGNGRPAKGHTPPPTGNHRPGNGGHTPGYGNSQNGGNRPGYGNSQNGGNRPGYGNPQNGGNRPGNGNSQNGGNRPGYGNSQNGGNRPGYGNSQNGGNRPGNGNSQNGGNNSPSRPSRTR